MDTPVIAGVALLVLVLVAVLCVVIVRKVNQIDLATRALAVELRTTRTETESLFGQLQALLALERKLELPEALPPMRGWAGSPDFLLLIANEIQRRRPGIVVECGSGVSTVVCARMLQRNGRGRLFSLEHSAEYAQATRQMLAERGLSEWATVVLAPLHAGQSTAPWYSQETLPQDMNGIDVLIVDGPPSSVGPLARYPALPVLSGRLAAHAVVILDDAHRNDERETLRLWASEYPAFAQHAVDCEKGCVVLVR